LLANVAAYMIHDALALPADDKQHLNCSMLSPDLYIMSND